MTEGWHPSRLPAGLTKSMYRAAVRQWLTMKTMPPEYRREILVQALICTGLLMFLVWGVVGLVAAQS